MKLLNIGRAMLMASAIGAGFGMQAVAQTPAARSMPVFEVDRTWPKVPAKWKLGDASSIAIDAQDNVWVLHRPRTLKPDRAAMAAPPVIVFDTAGNYIKAWGGSGQWLRMARTRAWHPYRLQGLRVARRKQLPHEWPARAQAGCRRPTLEVHAGRQVRHADRPQQSKQGQCRHDECAPARRMRGSIHRPTNCSWPTATAITASLSSMRIPASSSGCGAHSATSRWTTTIARLSRRRASRTPGPQQFSIVHAIRVAKDGTVYVADREYRRVQMFTKDGKFLKQLVRTGDAFRPRLGLVSRPGPAVSVCRRRQGHLHCRSQDAGDCGNIQPAGMIGPRPSDRDRFERQSLHRADRRRTAKTDIQRDVDGRPVESGRGGASRRTGLRWLSFHEVPCSDCRAVTADRRRSSPVSSLHVNS